MITWMLYAAAVGGLLAAASAAGEAVLRTLGRPRRWAWAIAIPASLLVPLVAGSARPGGAAPEEPAANVAATVPVAGAPAGSTRGPSIAERAEPLMPLLWLTGTVAVLALLFGSATALAVRQSGWRRMRVAGVPVLVSQRVGPAVAGALRPRIVLPSWALHCPESELRLMVAHECEHVAARDPLLLAGAWLAAAVMPWSPALWWQLRRLHLAVEMDCDARVLRRQSDIAEYGRLLLRVGTLGSTASLGSAAMAEPRSFLERRIRAMTAPTARPRAAVMAVAVLVLSAAAAAALPAPALPGLPNSANDAVAGADTLRIWDISDADQPPSLANPREVQQALDQAYPPLLRDAGVRGAAQVEMVVGVDGRARVTRLVQADHPAFGEAAISTIPRFRFRPAQRDGSPVRVRVVVPISFQLPPDSARSMSGTTTVAAAPVARARATGTQGAAPAAAARSMSGARTVEAAAVAGARATAVGTRQAAPAAAARSMSGARTVEAAAVAGARATAVGTREVAPAAAARSMSGARTVEAAAVARTRATAVGTRAAAPAAAARSMSGAATVQAAPVARARGMSAGAREPTPAAIARSVPDSLAPAVEIRTEGEEGTPRLR